MRPGTYIATAIALMALAAPSLGGCGGGHADTTGRIPDGPVTVYLSIPREGVEARAGEAVAAGARQALADAHGRSGRRAVRLVELDAANPQGATWDPAVVEENAKRAAADPHAVAYIGELDDGGSAVSVPVTNNAGLLQVSPLDGLTALTREQPGAPPGTGPARYYPADTRTFLRLVPTDAAQAEALVALVRERGARRLAVVQDEEVFGRVLAQQVVTAAERGGLTVATVAEPHEDPATFGDFALKMAATQPDAVIYTGVGDANSGALLATLKGTLPGARMFGSSALLLAAPPPARMPPLELLSPLRPTARYGGAAQRVVQRSGARGPAGAEVLYGYEAMRIVLNALAAHGAADRAAVARAALAPGVRRSLLGGYRVIRWGDVAPPRFALYERSGSGTRYLGERPLGSG